MMFLLRRHMTFYLAALVGILVLFIALLLDNPLAPTIAANSFFLVYLLLTLRALPKLTPVFLKKHAATADEPMWIIFLVTFATVVVATTSLFMVINQKPAPDTLTLFLSLASVPLGWATIHMMAAVHYAHMYWQPDESAEGNQAKGTQKASHRGGFEFPNTPAPAGWDFAYFAYVIGMTAQTSDTSVTTQSMRKFTLLHSIVSFFFNTVIVAAAVNVAVALGN